MNLGGTIRLNKFGLFVIICILVVFGLHVFSRSDTNNKPKVDLNILLNVAIKAAENGGKKVVENKDYMNIKSKGLTKEGLQEKVTNSDFLSHCAISDTIKHFFSSLKIISEEEVKDCSQEVPIDFSVKDALQFTELVNADDITVWIDPLDATQEYTEKLYKYVTTMVCVAVGGKPIIGVIHKPFENNTSWAWVDKGKSVDLTKQDPERKSTELKVIVSRSHKGNIEKVLQKNFHKKIEVVTAAGAGYKVLEVAKNHVDAYVHSTAIKKWDICAGNAVINALGGKMVNNFGVELDYSNELMTVNENGLIASLKYDMDFIGKLDIKNQ